jgi:serine protease
MTFTVAGRGGVPMVGSGATPTAVIANMAVTNTTAGSNLTVYPSDASQPLASDLNWVAGQTVSNLVVVKLSADGKITIYNGLGSTDVVIDVLGYIS